jgi:hypothetical protein
MEKTDLRLCHGLTIAFRATALNPKDLNQNTHGLSKLAAIHPVPPGTRKKAWQNYAKKTGRLLWPPRFETFLIRPMAA